MYLFPPEKVSFFSKLIWMRLDGMNMIHDSLANRSRIANPSKPLQKAQLKAPTVPQKPNNMPKVWQSMRFLRRIMSSTLAWKGVGIGLQKCIASAGLPLFLRVKMPCSPCCLLFCFEIEVWLNRTAHNSTTSVNILQSTYRILQLHVRM